MEISLIEIAAVLFGILIRLAIPVALTFLLAMLLKWLDKRWQAEAKTERSELSALSRNGKERLPCWEIHNCPPNLKKNCKAYAKPGTPCWEIFRANGRIKPACQTCKVLPPEIPGRLALT